MRTATLLLVGPNRLFRVGLRRLFHESPFTVVGEVSHVDAIDPSAFPEPDIALAELPDDPTAMLQALERLDATYPDVPVVVLSNMVSMASLNACFSAGAVGFLTTDISPSVLLRSLQLAVLGERVFPTDLAALLVADVGSGRRPSVPKADSCGLSGREVEIMQCLLRGEANKVIGARLGITDATIKVHIKSIMRKINASNRTQAAIWAYSHGFLPAGEVLPAHQGGGRFVPR